ncbi:hypothetical protein [Sphaerisporangium fuscum]|uniref:hypothetical protein n=1 Tax=Sphaerisporangium fuscum TaxID=2835868 RepID=UPI001BDC127C|nr:hypothetical protein [Sphaerisporangium fuscum]
MLSALADVIEGLGQWWYGLAGWLPAPLQALSFILVMAVAVRLAVKYALPVLAGWGVPLCRLALRTLAWLVLLPEYLITSRSLRTAQRMPSGAHVYGEAVAGLLEIADKGVTELLRRLSKSAKIANQVTLATVLVSIFVVNAVAYQANDPLPLSRWWDSVQVWAQSLG